MSHLMDEIAPDVITSGDEQKVSQPLKPLDTVIALYDFPGTQPSHLPLNLGDTIYVLSKNESGWWDGVILNTANGDLMRGWFPSNYVRSVNYVQPVLNKLKSNKELDSITAANTAANVLIPSFTSLLKKNINDGDKNQSINSTRKNSVVSFASSDASDKSEADEKQEMKNTELKNADIEKELAIKDSKESLEDETKRSSVSSVFDDANDKQASTPRLNSSILDTVGTIKYTSVPEATNLLEAYRKEHKKTPTWIPKATMDGNLVFFSPQLDIYCENIPMMDLQLDDMDNINFEIPSFSVLTDSNLLNENITNEISRQDDNVSMFKRDSNVSITSTASSSSSIYHHFSHPLYSMEGLFYYKVTDIKSWTGLKDEFGYMLNLSHMAVKENNKILFHKHFGELNKLLSLLTSSVRLSQHDFLNTKYENSIKRKVRRITSSFSQIYVNSILLLNFLHHNPRASKAQLFSSDMTKLNRGSYNTDFNNSISTNTSSVSTIAQVPFAAINERDTEAEVSHIQLIEAETANLKHNLQGLVKIFLRITRDKKFQVSNYDGSNSENSETEEDQGIYAQENQSQISLSIEGKGRCDVLPQNYPRLVANEFNGGNWCNPFFESGNPIFNSSGNDLKNKYHQKVLIDKKAYNSVENLVNEMINISNDTLEFLKPENQHLYYNHSLKEERNTSILRLSYKYLYYASTMVDLIESFDFTVFCLVKRFSSQEEEALVAIMNKFKREHSDLHKEEFEELDQNNILEDEELKNLKEKNPSLISTEQEKSKNDEAPGSFDRSTSDKFTSNLTFDYPVVLEFFHTKQLLHYLITNIILATQSLTLEDPDVFKGMKDEENKLYYNRDVMKNPKHKATVLLTNLIIKHLKADKGNAVSMNSDTLLSRYLNDGIKFYKNILGLIKSLIEERETIVNYATRVMHDDFNVQLLVIEQNNTMGTELKEDNTNSFITGKKNRKDVPWYLEGDDEFDLLTDVKGNIKGGTKEALVCHLTHHDLFDSNFNTCFLLTFASIMSASELINYLIMRFNIDAPEGLSYEEYNTWVSKKQGPIRLRVLNVMKLILEKQWSDSYFSENLIHRWIFFLQSNTASSYSISKTLISHLNKLLRGEKVMIERKPVIPNTRTPAPLLRPSLVKKLKLLDIDYIELARQLTIREFNLYSKITKFQCLAKVWNKKSGLNENIDSISNFIKASNQLTNFVAYMILRKQDMKKRVQVIRYFVQVAERCRQYNNFSSMTAIISALYSSPIHRLKKTWALVSNDTLTHLQNMNKLMNSSRNFNEYRDVLRFVGSEPCVPFFGVYLSDLTFVFHGNPDTLLNRSRMINFGKRAKTADILLGLDRFKLTGYNLLQVPEIQKYLDGWLDKCPTIEEQYQLSLNLEPRDNTSGSGSTSTGSSSKYKGSFPFSRV